MKTSYRCFILALVVSISFAGCGGDGPTAPQIPFAVTISAPDSVQGSNEADGYTCSFSTRAVARGGQSGDHAEWTSAEIEWRDPDTGQVWFRDFKSETWLLDFWGSDRIITGRTLESGSWSWWVTERNQPFTLAMTFRYHLSSTGENRSDTVFVDCE